MKGTLSFAQPDDWLEIQPGRSGLHVYMRVLDSGDVVLSVGNGEVDQVKVLIGREAVVGLVARIDGLAPIDWLRFRRDYQWGKS